MTASQPTTEHPSDATRTASTIFGGFLFLALFDAAAIVVGIPSPGLVLRLKHLFYDFGETIGMGSFLALLAFAFVRYVRMPRLALAAVALAVSTAVAYRVMGAYLTIVAQHVWDGRLAMPAYIVMILALGVAVAGAPVLAIELSTAGRIARALLIPFGIVVLVIDQTAWRDDYVDAHGILALGTLLFVGTVLAPRIERGGRWLAQSRGGRAAAIGFALLALFGLIVSPPDAVRFELFRQPCAIASWTLATLTWPRPGLHAPVPTPDSIWFRNRANAPPIPPTEPPAVPSDAVIVLLTLDAVRADVLANPDYDARFPTFARLKREGVVFTRARTPGTQTEISMTSLFSGRYFSELPWKDSGSGWNFHPHPATDTFVRFPEILEDRGVTTVNVSGIAFLAEGFGVVRGFREETRMIHKKSAESAFNLIRAMSDRLTKGSVGPLFICTHLTESHSPYSPGRQGDPDYQRYLTAIAYLDNQVGHILKVLQKNFGERWVLFVSADHGESFGQHQTTEHGKTLYEDLLRVPSSCEALSFPPTRSTSPSGSSTWDRHCWICSEPTHPRRSRARASSLSWSAERRSSLGRSSPKGASGWPSPNPTD